MISLDQDLQQKKFKFAEFVNLTIRLLNYFPNVLNNFEDKREYRIYMSDIAGTTKYVRPINQDLFIMNPNTFNKNYRALKKILKKIQNKDSQFELIEKKIIDKVIYTIQQSIGAGFDLLLGQNSARKHTGNRFEELVQSIFSELQIANKRNVLKIPYETDEGKKIYKCEMDLIISPYKNVLSTSTILNDKEIVISAKTTSKDRMGKIFIDKILLERFVGHNQKIIGIFLNDVQRKESNNISFTLVSGLFMVYTQFLTKLEGIYYLDPPPNTNKPPFNKYMKKFSEFLTADIWNILTS